MTTRLVGWIARHRQAFRCRTTYDIPNPWILYHYRIPDALAWLIRFSVIRTDCLICGAQEQGWLLSWRADHEVGPQRREIVERHRHLRLRWQPEYWRAPMGNRCAWRRWREDQIQRN